MTFSQFCCRSHFAALVALIIRCDGALKEIRRVRGISTSSSGKRYRCENADSRATYAREDRKIATEGGSGKVCLDPVGYAPVILSSIHLERSRCRVIAGSSKAIFFREPVYSESASSASYSCGRPLEKHRTREIPTEKSAPALDFSVPCASTIARPNSRARLQTSRVIKMQFSIFLVCFRLRRGGGGEERGHSA